MKTKSYVNQILSWLLIVVGQIWVLSCNEGLHETQMSFSLNGVDYSTEQIIGDTLDLKRLSVESKALICVNNHKDFDQIAIDGISLKDGIANVPVHKIAKDHFLTLTWTKNGKEGKLYLRTLHSDIPDMSIEGNTTSKGDFYLSYVSLCLIQKINNNGDVVMYEYMQQDSTFSGKCAGWWDFKKEGCYNNETYYSYHAPDANFINEGFSGFNPGMRVIFGDKYIWNADSNKVYVPYKTIHLKADPKNIVHEGDPIDGHDFYMFDENHYIVSSYVKRTSSKGKEVYAAYLQEVRNDSLIFDWWSTDYPDMEAWTDTIFKDKDGKELKDYVHFNSIDVLPDGNWLCSFRHISSILKIDRVGRTGNILWRLGGATGDSLYSFHGQHYVRYHEKDSTITLFNNGNLPNDSIGRTQMLSLKVDLNTGKVSKSTILHDDGYYTQACGALTFSGENMIVGWGIPGDTININNRLLTEYDKSGAAIFSISRPENKYNVNAALGSYRCVKCE